MGMTGQALIFYYSLQILSSSVRLDGYRWWTAIFRSFQRYSIGVKSGLWLSHSRTFAKLSLSHSCVLLAVCLGSLFCWKVNLRPSLRSRAIWTRFSLRIPLVCSLNPDQSSNPCCWKTPPQHDAATTMLHRWDGTGPVMSGAWFPPDMTLRIEAKQLWFHQTREQSESPLCAFLLIPSSLSFCLSPRRGFRLANLP